MYMCICIFLESLYKHRKNSGKIHSRYSGFLPLPSLTPQGVGGVLQFSGEVCFVLLFILSLKHTECLLNAQKHARVLHIQCQLMHNNPACMLTLFCRSSNQGLGRVNNYPKYVRLECYRATIQSHVSLIQNCVLSTMYFLHKEMILM